MLEIARCGYDAITLREIAEELGLPYTTTIVRFKTIKEFKRYITAFTIDVLREEMAGVPLHKSGDGLLELATSIGKHTPSRAEVSTLTLLSQGNLRDPDLAILERTRGEVFREAVSARMPKTSLPHDVAVKAFMAHIAGNVTRWHVGTTPCPMEYLVARTKEWLTLAHIPFRGARARAQSRVNAS